MRIVFSAVKKEEQLKWLLDEGARSFLFSFEDKKVIKQVEFLSQFKDEKLLIFIDSGAFSIFNRGAKIDLNEYVHFIDRVKKIAYSGHEMYFFNMDVIPHIKGTKPTKQQIDTAAKKGIENWNFIKSKGHSTIHTFHQFEGIDILRQIIKECNDFNLVGISPANDQSLNSRNEWLKTVFAEIKDSVRTHCLGLTAKDSVEIFPCFSADSSSWINQSRYMEGFDYKKLIKMPHTDRTPETLFWYDYEGKAKQSLKYYLHLEKYITELWKLKGVNWQ